MKELTLEKPQGPVVSVAESPACFRHLAENGLEPGSASDSTKDPTDCTLLLAHVLELAGSV
jgi:hypothetical protein